MRKIKFLFLLCLFCMISIGASAYDFCAVNDDGVVIYYNITSSTKLTCEVTYETSSYNSYSGIVNIPASVNSYSVTSIGNEAFVGCTGLTSVTIPNSVTSIGSYAFSECSGLTSVTIPNSVTSIGYDAFSSCSGLTSIEIPKSVTSIGDDAFEYCTSLPVENNLRYADTYLVEAVNKTLSTYTIKEGTKWIGSFAFDGCKGLTSVTIGNSVKSLGTGAFYGCSSLASIEIPNSVTSIGVLAFGGCTSLPVENNLRYADTYLVGVVDKTLSTYTIKDGTKWIGSDAFNNCTGLTSITIPNSVTSIGDHAFSHCSGLASVTIPNSVTSIESGAFSGCSGMTSIVVGSENKYYDSRENCNALIETATNTLLKGCKNTIIPNSVTSIGDWAFEDCTGLTSITIPNSVTNIGSVAFYFCSGLTSVTLKSNAIVSKAYSSSSNLENIFGSQVSKYIIGDDVTSIGMYAFYDCSGLTSITIPNSVTSIGRSAFCGCNALEDVFVSWSKPLVVPTTVFDKNASGKILIALHVPIGKTKIYQSADVWCDFYDIQEWDPSTGIEEIGLSPALSTREGAIYDLQGKRVECMKQGNIYIINGKKIINK